MEVEPERTDTDSLEGRMGAEPGQTNADGLKRAEATMRVIIAVCLLLDFALACLAAVQHFHV
jgi:hypothetical protein